jgi:preprotein translocase subunit SecG
MKEYHMGWERGESMLSTIFTILQIVIGLFLIFIIMLQRGKGGGLVGALGGMGGASAFGPKADIHVLKLTIGLAIAWVVVACTGIYLNRAYKRGIGDDVVPVKQVDKDAAEGADAGDDAVKPFPDAADKPAKVAPKKGDAPAAKIKKGEGPAEKPAAAPQTKAAADADKEAPKAEPAKPAAEEKKAAE